MISFQDSTHEYRNGSEKYISVTTLVGQYKNPFDENFWSSYKAYEAVHPEWKSLRQNYKYVQRKDPLEPAFIKFLDKNSTPEIRKIAAKEKRRFLKEWKNITNKSLFKGNRYHQKQEKKSILSGFEVNPVTGKLMNTYVRKPRKDSDNYAIRKSLWELEDGYYPELLIWNDDFKLAGQADRIFIETKGRRRLVDVGDFKTNKRIDTESYEHPTKGHIMMLPPLDHLMDCNYNHYSLQLSTYAWMMEQFGFDIRSLTMHHLNEQYDLPYMRKEVLDMLTFI